MLYRLKTEAVPYFHESIVTEILPLEKWDELHVDRSALEEVKEPYIILDHSKYNDEEGSTFSFKIVLPDTGSDEYDELFRQKHIRGLMDDIQEKIDSLYKELKEPF
jgi:hypothetical protein